MITLPNIDGKIWNLEQKILEMIEEYQKKDRLIISLNHEGPCASSLGLYNLLDQLCDRFHWAKSKITIKTNNVLEHHPDYVIQRAGPLYLDSVKIFCQTNVLPPKDFSKIKHFGMFIGRSNWTRLWISSFMHHKFSDQTVMTFHYDSEMDFHRHNLGWENMILTLGSQHPALSWAVNLVKVSPLRLDDLVPQYPIITPEHFSISKVYDQFFLEIVCETYCQGNTFYPTEKIWRPIACKTPFIVQGPRYYYRNLKRMGFKTFDRWWDEGFNEDTYEYQPNDILKTVQDLAALSTSELQKIYDEMSDNLEHNYCLLNQLEPNDFVRAFVDA